MNLRKVSKRHPGLTWALGAVEFIIIDALMILGITPAWAALSIPFGDRITIELGNLPNWIVAFVAAAGLWKSWRAELRAAEAVTATDKLGVKIDGMLVDRDAAKVKEGQAREKIVSVEAADQLQKGVEQGIAQERASVAAANPPVPVPGESPLPVADDRTAGAAERVATATERVAGAAEAEVPDKPK